MEHYCPSQTCINTHSCLSLSLFRFSPLLSVCPLRAPQSAICGMRVCRYLCAPSRTQNIPNKFRIKINAFLPYIKRVERTPLTFAVSIQPVLYMYHNVIHHPGESVRGPALRATLSPSSDRRPDERHCSQFTTCAACICRCSLDEHTH